jgi:hypothetical protein
MDDGLISTLVEGSFVKDATERVSLHRDRWINNERSRLINGVVLCFPIGTDRYHPTVHPQSRKGNLGSNQDRPKDNQRPMFVLPYPRWPVGDGTRHHGGTHTGDRQPTVSYSDVDSAKG